MQKFLQTGKPLTSKYLPLLYEDELKLEFEGMNPVLDSFLIINIEKMRQH